MENREELKNLHLTDEELDKVSGGDGGAIYGTGEVSISGENVTFNDSTGGASGGAIYSSSDVSISGGNVKFTYNTSGIIFCKEKSHFIKK